PGQSTVPTMDVGPVRSHCSPMTISALAWALAEPTAPDRATRRASRTVSDVRMRILLSSRTSVREWPDTEVAPDVAPEPVEPLGLDDEEADDERAEQDQAEVGDEVEHGLLREEHAAKGLHRVADHDGQQ